METYLVSNASNWSNLVEDFPPNSCPHLTNFCRASRTSSPRYFPDIVFSKLGEEKGREGVNRCFESLANMNMVMVSVRGVEGVYKFDFLVRVQLMRLLAK